MIFAISITSFLSRLNWIDGGPLVIEPYRLAIFRRVFGERLPDGELRHTLVLAGRAKKNAKSLDLILAGLFCLLFANAPQGNDVLLVANDEGQAGDDLDLAKKIIAANPDLAADLDPLSKEIRRKDGRGTMRVVASANVEGQHGKTAVFIGYDEIHGFTNWDLLEALQPDPTRYCLQWVTSYDSIFDIEGCPLHDLKKIGMAGTDERMLYSWYSADLCTDPNFAHLPPDQRANPSMASWPDGPRYLEQQRRRLPSARFRRLHWNLPGAPQGAYYDQGKVEAAIVAGRQVLEPVDGIDYLAAVDMSGGSNDDAVLSISHWDDTRKVAVQDVLVDQGEPTPFNPRLFVFRAAAIARRYRCKEVHGDAYAGETFRADFASCGLEYVVTKQSATDFYEALEVALNAGQAEMLDQPKLRRQLLTLIRKGASITHPSGQHDDHANATAIALVLANPDVGADYPHRGIFEHYKRMSEAATATAATPPTLIEQHGGEAIMQGWMRRPSDGFVKMNLPTACSHMHINGLAYLCEAEGGKCVVWVTPSDAIDVLGSASASALPLIELNRSLLDKLKERAKAEGYVPHNKSQGIRVQDMLQAIEDQRPKTNAEFAAEFVRMKGTYANEALRAMQAARRS